MDQPHAKLTYLFNRWKDGTATVSERNSLLELVQNPQLEAALKELIAKETDAIDSGVISINKEQSQSRANAILQRILGLPQTPSERGGFEETPVIDMHPPKKKLWWKYAAAAVIIIGLGSYFIFFNQTKKEPEIVKTETNDVEAPKGTKAMITLADGRTIALDSLTSLTQDNVTVIRNANGEIIYNGSSTAIVYNTLNNPRSSKVVNLTLSDGTKVWLNSESSLKYPTAFAGNIRQVEITGEAYFEVARDADKKFVVVGNGVTTEVLGTHFNVNTYSDESNIKVTLLEGSIHVNGTLIKPGQQAQVSTDVKVVNAVNLEAVMAWKNGSFYFNRAPIAEVMRQIARWYDVQVTYEGKVPAQEFGGEIGRDLNLSQVLRLLEKNEVHFRLEGKMVIVMP